MEVEGVEGGHRETVQRELGQIEGEGELRFLAAAERAGDLGVIAAHEDATGEVAAGGNAVDPGDGVFAGRLLGEGEELVEAVELVAVVVNFARDDGAQADLRPGDEAGETHAADGGGEPVGVLDGAADEAAAVGADEFEAQYVAAEGARNVVVLAVD